MSIAGAGEEVAVSIGLLIKVSTLLSSLTRLIYKITDALIDTSGSNGRRKGDGPHPVQGCQNRSGLLGDNITALPS